MVRDSFKEFSSHYTRSRSDIPGDGVTCAQFGTLEGGKNSHDIFIILDGAIEMAVQSKKPKPVVLVKWLIKKGVKKIEEEHQLDIEEKDAALALINDDLQDRDNQIQVIQYENVALQAERDVYQTQLKDVKTQSSISE